MEKLHRWFEERFLPDYSGGIANVFVLSGNVSDLMPDGDEFVSLRIFLARKLANREIVVFFDKSSGFTFGDEILGLSPSEGEPTMREKFKTAVGFSDEAQANNPFAALSGGGAGELPTDPEAAFRLLERLVVQGTPEEKRSAVVIDFAESILTREPVGEFSSTPVVAVQRWAAIDSPLVATGNPVILIERNGEQLSRALTNDGAKISRLHIARPDRSEHRAFIEYALKTSGAQLAKDLDTDIAANQLAGTRHVDFEDMCLKSIEAGEPITTDYIWARKTELIEAQSGGLLRVVRPKHGFEAIGDLEHIKEAMRRQVELLRSGDRNVDKGWILMGPPGTGKTITAEALAKESGLNFVLMGDIQSRFVGDSERNMSLALDVIQAMAPTIVFVDEAAESIGSGREYAGDSGVSNRIRAKMQNFMGDDSLRGKVFWLLATNWPNNLPPAMIREGRMDKRIPFFPPDQDGLVQILEAMGRKYLVPTAKLDLKSAAGKMDGYTGAEAEAIFLRAIQFAQEDGRQQPTTEDLLEACDDFILSRDQQAFDLMVALAIRYCNSRRMLPEKYRAMVGGVDKTIAELAPAVESRLSGRRRSL